MPTRQERLNAALSTKAPNRNCPFCGNTDWGFLDGPTGDELVLLLAGPEGQVDGVKGVGFMNLCLVCKNCGFVRLHSAYTLES
jgi:hypothetical protein